MTDHDPFADAPEETVQDTPVDDSVLQEPPAEAPKKAPAKTSVHQSVSSGEDGKVVVTLKGGTGFDAPWIVIHATDLDDALEQLSGDKSVTLSKVMERAQRAAQHFSGGGKPSGGGNPPKGAPQGSQDAPGGEKRFCEHGEMRFRSGVSKAGKPYKAFFCASGDRDNECKAQFL